MLPETRCRTAIIKQLFYSQLLCHRYIGTLRYLTYLYLYHLPIRRIYDCRIAAMTISRISIRALSGHRKTTTHPILFIRNLTL
jgi:hypothetical protein